MTTKASPSRQMDLVRGNRHQVLFPGAIPVSGKERGRVGHRPCEDRFLEA